MITNDNKPLFLQIKAWIEDHILRDEWQSGSQLPSVRELSAEFGVNPKQWLTEKMKSRILHLAKVRDTTPTEIANKVHMSQIKFFKFCRKYFDCTATELIVRVQGEE